MKWTLVVLSFLVLFSGSAIAQLTPDDIEKIRQVVKEENTVMRWWLTGVTGTIGVIIVALFSTLIYIHSHVSKEVEKVKEYRDSMIDRIRQHEEVVGKEVDRLDRSRQETQKVLRESRELSKEILNNNQGILDTNKEFLADIEKIIDQFKETLAPPKQNADD